MSNKASAGFMSGGNANVSWLAIPGPMVMFMEWNYSSKKLSLLETLSLHNHK